MGEVLRRLCSRLVCSRLGELILDVPFAVRDGAVAAGRWWGRIRWQVLDAVCDVPAMACGLGRTARALPGRGAGLAAAAWAGARLLVLEVAAGVRAGADQAIRLRANLLELRIAARPLVGALGRPLSWLKANGSRAAALAGAPLIPAVAVVLAIEAHSVRPSAATPPALRDASPPAVAPSVARAAARATPSQRARADVAPPEASVAPHSSKRAAVTRRTPAGGSAQTGQKRRTNVTSRVAAPRVAPTAPPGAESPGRTAPPPAIAPEEPIAPAATPVAEPAPAEGNREQPPAQTAGSQPPAPSRPAPSQAPPRVEAAATAPPQVSPAGQPAPSATPPAQTAPPVQAAPSSQDPAPTSSPPQTAPPAQPAPDAQPPAAPSEDDKDEDDEKRKDDKKDKKDKADSEDKDDRKPKSKGKQDHRDDEDDDD